MKILVVHDAAGQVKSVGVPGPEFAGQVFLVPGEGEQVSEVEAPDASKHIALDDLDQDRSAADLLEIVKRHRVEVTGKVPRLVPTEQGSAGDPTSG
jgi:hypothetical protein